MIGSLRTMYRFFKNNIHYYCNIRLPCFVVGVSSTEWFGTAFREFISIFCCTERNSELCSLPRNGSERNSENLHLFWFHGTEFIVVFSSTEWFGTELWEVASVFVPLNGTPNYFLFRGRVRNRIPRFSVRGTKIEANSHNSVPNHSAEENTTRNSVPWNQNRCKFSEFRSEPFRGSRNSFPCIKKYYIHLTSE
jgi:hypothetical protein